jgi:hypothetical protein
VDILPNPNQIQIRFVYMPTFPSSLYIAKFQLKISKSFFFGSRGPETSKIKGQVP